MEEGRESITTAKHFIGTIYLPNASPQDYCAWNGRTEAAVHLFEACVWQHEICPDTGRHHIQIYCHARRKVRYAQLNDALGVVGSWKTCKGIAHAIACYAYCTEEKSDASSRHGCKSSGWGDPPGRGAGGDAAISVDAAIEFAKSGKRRRELLMPENAEALRGAYLHPAGFRFVSELADQPRNTPDEWMQRYVICFWGGAGVGKSRRVREECAAAGLDLWVAPASPGGLWFDGYDRHPCALFDDFDGDMPWKQLLCILEGNIVQVQVKGGHVAFRPRVVYFTADCPPSSWTFSFGKGEARQGLNQARLDQLLRRFCHIEEVSSARDYREALNMNRRPAGPVPAGGEGGANIEIAPPLGEAWENVHVPQLPFDVVPDSEYVNELCNQ
ncbi:replication-associated protein [Sewage-associated circular DNA virus-35]|uniref:replication-associated protein n=1 Tax=Sewage-associated circular DNA virus-35 TaxID=1592102 RepID=UPI000585FDA5|nr:replication-associated protein [Sewage-associated circular DNA virus-35]AJD07566.1 replication-associated protein [Sewage-associated circular DNA virus-35]